MEARGPKPRCRQGRALSKASRERILPASSSLWWFYGPLACGCITTISAFIFIWPSPLSASLFCVSLIRTLVIGFRVHLIIQDEFISRSLKIYICKDPFFPQKRSHSQFWGCRNIIYQATRHRDDNSTGWMREGTGVQNSKLSSPTVAGRGGGKKKQPKRESFAKYIAPLLSLVQP